MISYSIDDDLIVTMGQVRSDILAYFDLKKPVYYAEVNLPMIEKYRGVEINYAPIAAFPAVKRDLALLVDKDVTYSQLEAIGRKYGSKLVKDIMLFDVYEGDKVEAGKKSYALTFVLQNPKKTLTDEEINKVMHKLVEAYRREAKAELRS